MAILGKHLKGTISPAEDIPHLCALLIDAMGLILSFTVNIMHLMSFLTILLHRYFMPAKYVTELMRHLMDIKTAKLSCL